MCAKHYENPKMLSRVTAKNVGDVFLRHTVVYKLAYSIIWPDGVETENDFSTVAVLHEADVSRSATDVELTNDDRDERSHQVPRVTVDVVDTAWRVHHERQVHRRSTDWIIFYFIYL